MAALFLYDYALCSSEIICLRTSLRNTSRIRQK